LVPAWAKDPAIGSRLANPPDRTPSPLTSKSNFLSVQFCLLQIGNRKSQINWRVQASAADRERCCRKRRFDFRETFATVKKDGSNCPHPNTADKPWCCWWRQTLNLDWSRCSGRLKPATDSSSPW